jgi:hypothetical protein
MSVEGRESENDAEVALLSPGSSAKRTRHMTVMAGLSGYGWCFVGAAG